MHTTKRLFSGGFAMKSGFLQGIGHAIGKGMPVLGLLLGSASLNAQPAVFENSVLTIPNAAVLDVEPGIYYREIILEEDQDGNVQVTSAQQADLVQVETVEVEVIVNVKVNGNKSVPCVDLEPPAIASNDNRITILLAETEIPEGTTCITMLDPFQLSIPLQGEELESGTYIVEVNDVGVAFDIEFESQPIREN